jgi:subtilisin family serine protease
MARTKAVLVLYPARAGEQLAYVSERAEIVHRAGDQLWVSLADEQVERFAAQGIVVQVRRDADTIQVPAGTFDPVAALPEPPAELRSSGSDGNLHQLVQFVAPPDPAWIATIATAGGEFVRHLPADAAVFRCSRDIGDVIRALPFVRWTGAWQPAYALGRSLVAQPDWLGVVPTATPVVAPARPADSEEGNVQVALFDDAGSAEVLAAVQATGAIVVVDLGYGFVVRADPSAVLRLVRVPGVFAVETFNPPDPGNDRSGVILGTDQVRSVGAVDFLVNLDGAGEIVGVIDSGLDTGSLPAIHADLRGRVLRIDNLTAPGSAAPDTTSHGTHVTGTIAGNGAGSAGRMRGVAPAAWVVFHGPVIARAMPGLEAAHTAGARVHNNSWGSQNAVTGNAYVAGVSDTLDQFCFVHPDSLVVFITHNWEGDVVPAPGGDGVLDANRLPPQAASKNVLAVGATESLRSNDGFAGTYQASHPGRFNHRGLAAVAGGAPGGFSMSDDADQVALFSNRGRVAVPVGTGWVRPDLVAPGTNILSLRSSLAPPGPPPRAWFDPTTEDAALYRLDNGTSMAAPQVSGSALLTRQYYRARFGQLRRPTLLEAVPLPAVPPRPEFSGRPAIAAHADGLVLAWVRPAQAAAQRDIRAVRLTRDLTVAGPAVVQLRTDVGGRPAPALARHGDRTLLVHRAKDATICLSAYRRDLTADAGFGNAGTVTLSPTSRQDDSRPPALAVVADEVAVAWGDGGGDRLLFQRFDARTGTAIDAAAVELGPMLQASPLPYLVHNGARYALTWVDREGSTRRLHVRLVDGGTPVGPQARVVLEQNADVRDPSLTWDPRRGRFVLVWCDGRASAGGDVRLRFLDAEGAPQGAEVTCLPVPGTNTVRRPAVAVHPDVGYVLTWEDDTQGNHQDVYLGFLGDDGQPDGRIPQDPRDPLVRRLIRVSDTPDDTAGYAGVVDATGVTLVWQSTDEINSDRRGAFAVALTRRGAFRAQADPATPLVDSGRYVGHVLLEHTHPILSSVSMVAAGGTYFLVRGAPGDFLNELQVVRTDADSRPEPAYGPDGARALRTGISFGQVEAHWTGSRLVCVSADHLDDVRVWLLDAAGAPVPTFGTGGQLTIDPGGMLRLAISPQLGTVAMPAPRIVVVFGTGFPDPDRIRYAVLDETGAFVTAPRDLVPAGGTARHGWFHVVASELRSIAAWHRRTGVHPTVFVNRFAWDGTPQHAADVQVTALAGESVNPALAVRPTFVNSVQREYGVVWQYRATGGQPWELRFSRLDRNGQVRANPPAPAPPVPTSDVQVIGAGVGGWPTETDAVEPQLVSSLTHDPWANPPSPLPPGTRLPGWSPGYGLAWLGAPSGGGSRTLYFTVLDENGARAPVAQPPPNPPAPAPISQVSRTGVDVREFRLVWNGRTFRLTWTEVEGATVRHVQTAVTRHGSSAVYEEPSAALLRATLVNGATNLRRTELPNLDQPPPGLTSGYGWGRVNLRQSLAPSPPVTFAVRDDGALGSGRTARYHFHLPAGTALLRATLTWMDPPGPSVVNRLHLRITTPAGGAVFQGNTWRPPPDDRLSRAVAIGTPFQSTHTTEQIVLENPPSGVFDVEVIAEIFPSVPFNQSHTQPYALVFVGSGAEVRFGGLPGGRIPVY